MSSEAQRPSQGNANALPIGTRLREFEVLSVLGAGGFGIVYLAMDHALEREVAIKEYMPSDLAGRTETLHVSIRSKSDAEIFNLGRESFVKEAKMLARFEHPSLLKVYHFWEDNGTAYMTMPVLRGQTVKELRRGMSQPPDEAWLRQMLDSLLGAIETLHAKEIYHRDIAPDNIQIEPDGRPVLMDFGAARRVLGDKTTIVTTIVKPTYSPIEQFSDTGAARQGPWTDLYALGGTLHFLLLSRPPQPATARMVHDDDSALTTAALPGCSEEFLRIVDWMLAPHPGDRPQSVAVLRDALAGRISVPLRRSNARQDSGDWDRTIIMPPPGSKTVSSRTSPPTPPPPAPATATTPTPVAYDEDIAATIRVPPPSQPPAAPSAPRAFTAMPAQKPRSRLLPIGLGVGALVVVAGAVVMGLNRKPSGPAPEASAASAAVAMASAPALSVPETAASATVAVAAVPAVAQTPALAVTPRPESAVAAVEVPAATRPEAGGVKAIAPPLAALAGAGKVAPANKTVANPRQGTTTAGVATTPVPVTPAPEPVQRAPEPAPAPTPVATQPTPARPAVTNPEALCAGRNPLSYFVCMDKECRKPEQAGTADCKAWHKNARNPND